MSKCVLRLSNSAYLYNDILNVLPLPNQAQKGGLCFARINYIIFPFFHGEYSSLLYLQMVGQKGITGNQPKVQFTLPKRNRKPHDLNHRGVFVRFASPENQLYHFAYWHYSICKSSLQYSILKSHLELVDTKRHPMTCRPDYYFSIDKPLTAIYALIASTQPSKPSLLLSKHRS